MAADMRLGLAVRRILCYRLCGIPANSRVGVSFPFGLIDKAGVGLYLLARGTKGDNMSSSHGERQYLPYFILGP